MSSSGIRLTSRGIGLHIAARAARRQASVTGDLSMTTRRKFLQSAPLAIAAATLLGAMSRASFAQAAGSSGMLKRAIPASGELVPAIGMGTSGSFEVSPGSAEYQALKEVL